MSDIKLQIFKLRKSKGVSQKELADYLSVSGQTVSKWENGICMPDIALLPELAEYFQVSVDELLGLKLPKEEYIPSQTHTKEYWGERLDYLKRTRDTFWNVDYLEHLVNEVWCVKEPVDVLDFGCGYGFLGSLLMPLLPEGSTYTGIEQSETLLEEAEKFLEGSSFAVSLLKGDFYEYPIPKKYDICIAQVVLRHVNTPERVLQLMYQSAKRDGMVICIDVNREMEADGLYISGMDYSMLCESGEMRKVWQKELTCQGRDYAIGMRLPFYMQNMGLRDVGIRMNDRVSFIYPGLDNHHKIVEDFMVSEELEQVPERQAKEKKTELLMNHGMEQAEAEKYCIRQDMMGTYFREHKEEIAYLQLRGLLISYGWK